MKLKDLSRYRGLWMGFAIIWIVIYHSGLSFNFFPLQAVKKLGYCGVDICLFASGLGCYASLNRDGDPLRFMKRRFLRLAPVYFPFIVPWLLIHVLCSGVTPMMLVGNLLGIFSFTGLEVRDYKWYISALLLMYVLAPYFKALLDRLRPRKLLIVLLFLTLCSVPFWTVRLMVLIVTRVPIFFVGMYAGKLCCEDECVLTQKQIARIILAMIIGLVVLFLIVKPVGSLNMWNYGLYWYPFILITPGLCLCLSCAAIAVGKIPWLAWLPRLLESVGKYSFELYLLHYPIRDMVFSYIDKLNLHTYSNLIWLGFLAVLPIVLVCFRCYVRLVNRAAGALRRRWCH